MSTTVEAKESPVTTLTSTVQRKDPVKSVAIRSSLVLQILIVFHPYYYAFYWLCTLGMLIYKGLRLHLTE
ncbi:hypothetical protein HDU91_006240 [Kappamyces sp. JEL0680]|nr:hypothetical protein HDU91_006240 [Kappamyces sp. JEL0680]